MEAAANTEMGAEPEGLAEWLEVGCRGVGVSGRYKEKQAFLPGLGFELLRGP